MSQCKARNPKLCRKHGIKNQIGKGVGYSGKTGAQMTREDIYYLQNQQMDALIESMKLYEEPIKPNLDTEKLWKQSLTENPNDPAQAYLAHIEEETNKFYINEYKKKPITISSIKGNWVELQYGDLTVQAKVFENGSHYGIPQDNRISKLSVYHDKARYRREVGGFFGASSASYDRKWDIKPSGAFNRFVVKEVIKKLKTITVEV